MKKKVTVGTTLVTVLLAILLTFQLTYSFVGKEYQKKVDSLTKTQSDFSLLAEADTLIRDHFYGGIEDEKVESGLLAGYVSALGDPYSAYLTQEEYARYQKENSFSGNGIGVRLTYDAKNENVVVYSVFRNSPAQEAGIRRGDVLFQINDTSVQDLGFYDTLDALSGEEGTEISLTVKREIAQQVLKIDFHLTRRKVSANFLDFELLEGNVGYVQIFAFEEGFQTEFESALTSLVSSGASGVVFDVRNTSGGSAACALSALDRLLPQGVLVRTTDHKGEKGEIKSDKTSLDLPMAVLINGNTSFASEIFAAVLKDFDAAVLVGETTYGKSVGQEVLELSGGSALVLSNVAYTPPTSPSFENVGVEPDISCKLRSENLYLISHEEDDQWLEAYHAIRNR